MHRLSFSDLSLLCILGNNALYVKLKANGKNYQTSACSDFCEFISKPSETLKDMAKEGLNYFVMTFTSSNRGTVA